jgi:hypothetical protein
MSNDARDSQPHPLLKALTNNWLLTALSSLTVLYTAVSGFIRPLGLAPFWSDLATAALLWGSTLLWARAALRADKAGGAAEPPGPRQEPPRVILSPSGTAPQPRLRTRRGLRLGLRTLCALALLALTGWVLLPAVSALFRRPWELCGSFLSHCDQGACLHLFDSRGRGALPSCARLDDSGYTHLRASFPWVYRPTSAAIECHGEKSRAVSLTETVWDRHCVAVIDLRR